MLEVQFHSQYDDEWKFSPHSGLYRTAEELSPRIGTMRLYRCRASSDLPWELVPNQSWPHRYRTGTYLDSYRWYNQLDNIQPDAYPVLDCVYMTEITLPPQAEEPTMPTTSTAPTTAPDSLVELTVGRDKYNGRLTLEINAKPLHDLLDSMGAKTSGTTYVDRPACSYTTISNSGKMSTELLLRREYPMKLALGPCFERPPTIQQLKSMCESGHAAVQTILAHYQPIDISYRIVKVVK